MTELSAYFEDLTHYSVMPWQVSRRHLYCIHRLRQELKWGLAGSSEIQNGWRRRANLETMGGIRKVVCEGNLRLVITCAKSFKVLPQALPELIAEGNIGLLAAIDTFDLSRKTRLSTYASYLINTHMRNWVNSQSMVLKRGSNQRVGLLVKACRALAVAGNINPNDEEITDWLNEKGTMSLRGTWKPKHIVLLRANKKRQSHFSLDKPIGDEGCLGDIILGEEEESGAGLDARVIWRCLERHTDVRDLDVIRRRLADENLVDIGHSYGLTRERIRQIETNTLERVRMVLRCHRHSWMPLASLLRPEERPMARAAIARWLSYHEPPPRARVREVDPEIVDLPIVEFPEDPPMLVETLSSSLVASSLAPCRP